MGSEGEPGRVGKLGVLGKDGRVGRIGREGLLSPLNLLYPAVASTGKTAVKRNTERNTTTIFFTFQS